MCCITICPQNFAFISLFLLRTNGRTTDINNNTSDTVFKRAKTGVIKPHLACFFFFKFNLIALGWKILLKKSSVSEWVSKWVIEWMCDRSSDRSIERVSERASEWVSEWVSQRVSEWMNGWVRERVGEVGEWVSKISFCECRWVSERIGWVVWVSK